MKIIIMLLAIIIGTESARADPVTVVITAIASIATSVGSTLGVGSLISFASIGAFIGSPIGALIVGIGLSLVLSAFLPKRQAPSADATKVNVKLANPDRWILAGETRSGGAVVFAEFDSLGNFWYVVIHADSLMGAINQIYFDSEVIATDSLGNVTSNDFCLDNKGNLYAGSGTKVTYFQIWTTTYTPTNPIPPAITQLETAFPGINGWTTDHKLVGTTYSVIKMLPVSLANRYKIYKWHGPIGLGEPAVSLVAEWSVCYDPRDPTQILGSPATYKFTRNPVLIWAWFRTQKRGRNKPESSINWIMIGQQATICEQIVYDYLGNPHVRYNCDTAIPETAERASAEQQILMACDGQIVFDETGLTWIRVGYYYEPTLTLSRNRDFAGLSSVQATDGESQTQGVIVNFMDPGAAYQMQPSAAWDNPLYYSASETPQYLTIDIPTCQDHNQAMRLAKAYGYRSQPEYKLAPIFFLRALKARQERIINIIYDNTFSGPQEIVAPIELDKDGIFCGAALVPVDSSRWTLLSGEEKPKPVYTIITTENDLQFPTTVVLSYAGTIINVTFDPIPRADWRYEFQYRIQGTTNWLNMITDAVNNFAYSGAVLQNTTYEIQYRTVATSGEATDYFIPLLTILTQLLLLTGTPVTTATHGSAYSGFTVVASGGSLPYVFTDLFGRLPPGITINPSSGSVSGTPTTAAVYSNIVIRVADSKGALASFAAFTITVS